MSNCLVIGGGVSGMLTALHLQAEGLTVTLIEKNTLGQESSWAGGGILSPLYPWRYPDCVNQLAHWSQTHYPDFFDDLYQRTKIDPEYIRNGFLILDTAEVEQAKTWAAQYKMPMERLDSKALSEIESELGEYDSALWFPDVGQVRNPRMMKSLCKALDLAGIEVKEHQSVTKICSRQNKIYGIETEQDEFGADYVVVTAGAWSGELLSSLGVDANIRPIRGQMIMFEAQPGLVSRIVLANNHYVIPRRDGHVLVGSTVEDAGFKKVTTLTALEDLKYLAFSVIPRLTDYTVVHQWAGLRPGSPSGIPYIGQHPDIEGLFVNTGHFRNGIVLGLASARLLTDLILQREPIINPAPFHLSAPRGDKIF
ncbi:MAG: glycine oxidase ThiO [Thiotrichaceae bacterium]|nr:glycine oxidase ThiO [Thiotrichaceae bacterium]